MSKKKSKIVMVDGIPIKPISAAEHRRVDMRIKKKNEKRRERYREVHGKKVDWISHWIEEGIFFFTVRFMDGKRFSVTYSPTKGRTSNGRMEDCGHAPNAGRSAGRNDCLCRARETFLRQSCRNSLGVEL